MFRSRVNWFIFGFAVMTLALWAPAIKTAAQNSRLWLSQCTDRESIHRTLGDRYQERQVFNGVSAAGNLVELWASDQNPRTWSWVEWLSKDYGCLRLTGEGWKAHFITYHGEPL